MLEKKFVKLYKEGKIKQCVLVWVEPYLIAGHVIVLNTDYTEKTNEYLLTSGAISKFLWSKIVSNI